MPRTTRSSSPRSPITHSRPVSAPRPRRSSPRAASAPTCRPTSSHSVPRPRAMPTPARPSDYTLTERDAARLRSGGWRRFVAILGTSRDALSRPLAVGLTTLGLAGLLVSAAPSFMMGSASSAAPTTIGAPAGGSGGRERRRGPGHLARRRSLRPRPRLRQPHPPPRPPATSPAPGSTSPRHRCRHRPAMADSATQPPGTEAYTNGTTKAQSGSTGGDSGEPDSHQRPAGRAGHRRRLAPPGPVGRVPDRRARAVRAALDGATLRRLTAPSLEVRGARGYT